MTAVDLPEVANFWPVSYSLARQTRVSGLKGGIMQAVDDGPPFWRVTYETSPLLTDVEYAAWQAWLDGMRGGIFQFNAWVRKYPISYAGGAYPGGFADDATISAVGSGTVTITGLPVGFALVAGDVFTILGDVDRLHRVLVGGVADGSGDLTVTIDPPAHASVEATDAVQFSSPFFTAQIQPEIERGSPLLGKRAVRFSAIQRLKP